MRPVIALPIATLMLASCATLPPGACDPRNQDVSIIHKMQCDGSGGYRQTVDQKEGDLLRAQEENALFRQSLQALEEQRASFSKSVHEQQKARDKVVATTRKLLDQIKSKGITDQKIRTQLDLAEKDLQALQAQPAGARANDTEVAAKQRKVQELEQMVKRLRTSLLAS